MSTDPISCEMQTIKMMRLNKKSAGNYGVDDMPGYLGASAGVAGALSDATYNIGIIDEAKMDIRRIIDGATQIVSPLPQQTTQTGPHIVASLLPGRKGTFFEYRLPPEYIGKKAAISIYSLNGIVLFRKEILIPGQISHFSWNNRDRRGNIPATGNYLVKLTSGTLGVSAVFPVIR